ncbi:MAG: hypothetical protein KDE19_14340 [Caldilineaceae bacterium]|nr:hypothetical protein [Caldilineaceae bacterium]
MNTSLTLTRNRRWIVALFFGLAMWMATIAVPYLDPHSEVATELPPAIADPTIGAGGGGNG